MSAWTWLPILVLLIASRPIEARLWRAGRISDRAVTTLLLARFPIVVAIGALSTDGLSLLTIAVVGVAVLATAPFYRFMLGIVREQAADRHRVSSDVR